MQATMTAIMTMPGREGHGPVARTFMLTPTLTSAREIVKDVGIAWQADTDTAHFSPNQALTLLNRWQKEIEADLFCSRDGVHWVRGAIGEMRVLAIKGCALWLTTD